MHKSKNCLVPTEEEEQREFVRWLDKYCYTFTALGQSTPAGRMVGNKWLPNYKTLARNRAVGIRKGFPDICIFCPVSRSIMFVELKRKNGVLSDVGQEQRMWIELLRDSGVTTVVCCGALEAIQAVKANDNGETWKGRICQIDDDCGNWN